MLRVLPHGREINVGEARQPAVVVPDDGYVIRNRNACADERVEQPESAIVVVRDDGGGQGPFSQEQPGHRGTCLLGLPARDDADPLAQAVPTHGGAVPTAAGRRHRTGAAIDVDDLLVPQPHQVIHCLT